MKTILKYLCFTLILCLNLHSQPLQDSIVFNPQVEASFIEAIKFFNLQKYDTAASLFIKNIKDNPRSHRTTGAYIMSAKAYYHLKNYRESIRLLKDMIDIFPQSTYLDDCSYMLGLNYYFLDRYEDASFEFLKVIQSSTKNKLVDRSIKLLEIISQNNLSIVELGELQSSAISEEIKALLNLRIAEKHLQSGNLGYAVQILKRVASLPVYIKYSQEATEIINNLEKVGGVKIGVVLPLLLKSEDMEVRELGLEFLQGIKIAVEEYNQVYPIKVTLDIRDTENDQSVVARQVADLCGDENVSAIIGPILSKDVFACAGIANERGVPLITPTATQNGIAAIGVNIFQANPDIAMRGKNVAAYAYHNLNARKFAILAPSDPIGKLLTEAFIAQLDSMKAEIVDVQWYAPGTADLRMEISAIRRKALEKTEVPVINFAAKMKQSELNKILDYGVSRKLIDSLNNFKLTVPVTLLFGDKGELIADSLKLPTIKEHLKYDSLGMPVTNIDAIFLPIASAEEIPIISSQIKYFNFKAQLIGTGEWNDINILDQNRQYTDSIIFISDTYINKNSDAYKIFSNKYKTVNNNKSPGINALFGYDAAKLVLNVLANGKSRRKDIAETLSKIQNFEGLHSNISLTMDRVNSYLSVMQYRKRQIVKIGSIDLSLFMIK